MTSLPPEIIAEIAQHLCFHCQNPGDFPGDDTHDIHEEKRTLARLCRASRLFCTIVRPVLYHYYASRNFFRPPPYRPNGPLGVYQKPPDYLPEFARTLASRPDLASHVVSLRLAATRECPRLEGPRGRFGKPCLIEADPRVSWHSWLVLLTTICPRVSSVLIDLTYRRDISFLRKNSLKWAPSALFPSLRTVALIADSRGMGAQEMKYFLEVAPNLEELFCHTANSTPQTYRASDFRITPLPTSSSAYGATKTNPIAPKRLKRLTNVGMQAAPMAKLLHQTPGLEWLECYLTKRDRPGLDTIAFPVKPLSKTIRGLCIGYAPQVKHEDDEMDMFQPLFADIWALRDLTALEHLEHLSVYCGALSQGHLATPKKTSNLVGRTSLFVNLLPPGIRTLRVSWVDRDLQASLQGLADVARVRFPRLEKIGIGFAEDAITQNLSYIANALDDAPQFVARGIQIGWTVDCGGPSPGGMVSGDSADSDEQPVPEFPLTLEGPQWHLCDRTEAVSWGEICAAWQVARGVVSF